MVNLNVPNRELTAAESECLGMIEQATKIKFSLYRDNTINQHGNLISFLQWCSSSLQQNGKSSVSAAIEEVVHYSTSLPDFGGYGLSSSTPLSLADEANVTFLCAAFLEALRCAERAGTKPQPLLARPTGRRGMTISEKIFAMHDVSHRGFVEPGDIIQVDVDWILASELSWGGMKGLYDSVGRPGIFRNDRFWLAGDHRVEPSIYDKPAVKKLMSMCESTKQDLKMTEFQGFNYTIMHTEFVRERAQPGMLCIGADSHSCSAGAVSCLSIGMGATDVVMPLVTGQTWFSVPHSINIRLVGKPPAGIGGKDTILYILKEFKRNTVAADRVVEFTGPGLRYLSCDARFAIANMCTEFGAVTGVFEADERTVEFVERRRMKKHRNQAMYFRADGDATYAETFEVDLSQITSFVAVFPSPDNVVPVGEVAGTKLDGCFIGACTTAEEDLVLGALVLQAGLESGLKPAAGRRLVVPGSRPIRHKLEKLGLLDVYARAGFKVGVPGCSMCAGQGIDQALPGEVWLSSQNRNFKNRMGPGSIANLASAATVAASSFDMTISDPQSLLAKVDFSLLRRYLKSQPLEADKSAVNRPIQYVEPFEQTGQEQQQSPQVDDTQTSQTMTSSAPCGTNTIHGKALRLGDMIDTDAIIPSEFLTGCTTDEEYGTHCMEYFMPEFRQMVKDGLNIVVAGTGFGCGSSRDVAVNALLGAGVTCVIARSFAFIYARNQPNIGLLGITIDNDEFFELAEQGADISIDLDRSRIHCGGLQFPFRLSEMEKRLIAAGGLTEAFRKFGSQVFDKLCEKKRPKDFNGARDIETIAL